MARYFEVTAMGHNQFDTQFDRDGMYVAYVSLIQAGSKVEAEAKLRKEKRFRRSMYQNNENWRTVPVIVERTSAKRGI